MVGFILPLRPTVSEAEGRRLSEFPRFNIEAFLSGEYTSQINLWYSDTFPGRDRLIRWDGDIKSLYGIKTVAFGGGNVEKDEINVNDSFVWNDITEAPPKGPVGSEPSGETDGGGVGR